MSIDTSNHPATDAAAESRDTSSIKMQAVDSSQIHSVGHDPDSKVMEVWFKDRATGGVQSRYRYREVPASKFADMLVAPSVGAFFKQHFQYNAEHPYTKLS